MTVRREDLLEACLQSLRRGASIDDLLAEHPQWADELRPLLETATAAGSLASAGVPRHALVQSRNRFLQRAASLRPPHVRRLGLSYARPALAGLLAAVVLLLGGGGVAAAQSLPGDALYGAKILAEDVMLRLASSPGARLRLEETYDDRRAAEVRRLLALGRTVPVEFVGVVQESSVEALRVADIAVRLAPAAHIEGDPFVGTSVEVRGTTQSDDTVLADQIRVSAFDLYGVVDSISPQAWVIAGRTLAVTDDSVLDRGLAVGDPVLARVLVGRDGTLAIERLQRFSPPAVDPSPTPSRTPSPTVTLTPSPEASETSESGEDHPEDEADGTRTPQATGDHEDESEEGDEVDFSGTVESIGATQWMVEGRIVRIDGSTEIRDNPQVGDSVKVRARRESDGGLLAERIESDEED